MKPIVHSDNSVKKWKGKRSDYLKIHNWFDETKGWFGDNRHRVLRHHSQGIFKCEKIFGETIINSDNIEVSVRDIGEQHVFEDLGFIPSVGDYLQHMQYQAWMGNEEHNPNFKPKISKIEVEFPNYPPNIFPPNTDYKVPLLSP